jgi:hypothetical protein
VVESASTQAGGNLFSVSIAGKQGDFAVLGSTEPLTCRVCGQVRFVNPQTVKVLDGTSLRYIKTCHEQKSDYWKIRPHRANTPEKKPNSRLSNSTWGDPIKREHAYLDGLARNEKEGAKGCANAECGASRGRYAECL